MGSYVQLLLVATGATALAFGTSEAQGQCGNLIKSIDFEGCVHVPKLSRMF